MADENSTRYVQLFPIPDKEMADGLELVHEPNVICLMGWERPPYIKNSQSPCVYLFLSDTRTFD